MHSNFEGIRNSVTQLLKSLPSDVTLVAASKGRSAEEVRAAIESGVQHIGHNYIQESEAMIAALGDQAKWHMIGHLQRNKAKKATQLFDMIETLDSLRLAKAIEKYASNLRKVIPVLIEINSGRESNKTGVFPEALDALVASLTEMKHLQIQGLMTMGPRFGNPEDARPYFRETRKAFDRLASLKNPQLEMHYLSMGMSNSYLVAIEEGANMVRIGTRLFGECNVKG